MKWVLPLCLAILAQPAQAVIVWIGTVSSDLTADANWDFSGSSLTTIAGINAGAVADSLLFTTTGFAPIIGEVTGTQPGWGTTSGFTITLDGVFLNTAGNDGLNSGSISLINGADLRVTYLGANTTASSGSSINLLGTGDPLPLSVQLNLSPGADLTLSSGAQFTNQANQILVNGVSYASNPAVLSFNSPTNATAVPEPGVALLAFLGCLGLTRRRRV